MDSIALERQHGCNGASVCSVELTGHLIALQYIICSKQTVGVEATTTAKVHVCQELANALRKKNWMRSLTPVLRFPPYCFWPDNTLFITVRSNMRVSSGGKVVSPRVYALARRLLKQEHYRRQVQGISKSWYVYR